MPIPEKIIIPANKDPGDGHFAVSIVKSIFRFVASAMLVMQVIPGQRTTILISLLQMQDS